MTQAITIKLSDTLYTQLKQASKLFQQPIEKIVEQSLSHSLPPLLEDIPVEYQANVFPLLEMSDTELQTEAQKEFDAHLWTEYEALLDKKKNEDLTKLEQSLLEQLKREADVLSLRKGYAMVLLKGRGHQILLRNKLSVSL